jgi:hypothetical protein
MSSETYLPFAKTTASLLNIGQRFHQRQIHEKGMGF